MNVIVVENLCKAFNGNTVLCNLSLTVKPNTSLVILGCSGSGKTVLLKTMTGLITPDTGRIIINNHDITQIAHNLKTKLISKCGVLFQGGALFDSLSVKDNITFYAKKLYNLSSSEASDLAEEKLRLVGLQGSISNLYPSDLSGGMQKRVAFARTICTNPQLIFFDEPTSGLDPIMTNLINQLIVNVKEKLNATTITITHDISSAYKIADYIAMLYKGKIVWYGQSTELQQTKNEFVQQFIKGRIDGPIKLD